MDGFDHLLNWKLKAGSHRFPGPDGGTCINEAALVAAGYKYKSICFIEQMPKCFSRPICRLAMRLNDMASDEDRQRLLPQGSRINPVYPYSRATGGSEIYSFTGPSRVREPQSLGNLPQT